MLINYQHCWFTAMGLLLREGCCSADNLLITAAGLFTGDYCCGGYYLLVYATSAQNLLIPVKGLPRNGCPFAG